MSQPSNTGSQKKLLFEVSPHIQNYISSLFLIIIFPLAPILIVDYMIIHEMSDIDIKSLTITASIYFATIGFSSKSKITLILGILGCFSFAVIYGRIEPAPKVYEEQEILQMDKEALQQLILEELLPDKEHGNGGLKWAGIVCILIISLVHAVERYNRHVILKEQFFEIT